MQRPPPSVHRCSRGQREASSSFSSSQHVDDVREEDEANDGEKHQHQNVHHDGNYVRDGR